MNARSRSSLALGLILVLLGAWFLAVQLVPELQSWVNLNISWPLFVISAGAILLFAGLLTGVPALAIPASIVAGIGVLLYWQNTTGNWESWSYAWTLIPGFAGVGTLISGLIGGQPRTAARDGLRLVLTSLVLFAIFASFLGGLNLFGEYWPVLVILLGIWLLVEPWLKRRQS